MPLRLLATGDIHIGRRTSRTATPWRTADAWRKTVELAIAENVDLLLMSGDIIDKAAASYEATGPLLEGLAALEQAGIPVVTVTGNHDWNTLARLASQHGMHHLTVLGANGSWQAHTLERDGEAIAHIIGWSFPAEHHPTNPLLDFPDPESMTVPTIGLLHTEAGVSTSTYAPTAWASFERPTVDFWLIGHIHIPAWMSDRKVLQPGSPFAMDPGEPGVHGPWLVTISPGATPDVRQLPVSPVEYLTVEVDTAGVDDENDLQNAVRQALAQAADSSVATDIVARIRLTGATSRHAEIPLWADRIVAGFGSLPTETGSIVVDRCTAHVTVPIDLDALAQDRQSPAGEVAQLLLALESTDSPFESDYRDLIDRTRDRANRTARDTAFAGVDVRHVDDAAARALLLEQGRRLLSGLIATKGELR